jgi:hypothetical protein
LKRCAGKPFQLAIFSAIATSPTAANHKSFSLVGVILIPVLTTGSTVLWARPSQGKRLIPSSQRTFLGSQPGMVAARQKETRRGG